MAQDNRFDPVRLDRIERRLQALEDAEAIRNLKARYAALCDNQYDADGIGSLFAEDAVWESPALGRFEGRMAVEGGYPPFAGACPDGKVALKPDKAGDRVLVHGPNALR